MPIDGYYGEIIDREHERKVDARRHALTTKWRAMGCTENKIQVLIGRRMRSRRQWW